MLRTDYASVAVSQTAKQVSGEFGIIERVFFNNVDDANCAVTLIDSNGLAGELEVKTEISLVSNGHAEGAFSIEVGAMCKNGGWYVTTGSGITAVVVGRLPQF